MILTYRIISKGGCSMSKSNDDLYYDSDVGQYYDSESGEYYDDDDD